MEKLINWSDIALYISICDVLDEKTDKGYAILLSNLKFYIEKYSEVEENTMYIPEQVSNRIRCIGALVLWDLDAKDIIKGYIRYTHDIINIKFI